MQNKIIEIPTHTDYNVPIVELNPHANPTSTIIILPALNMKAVHYLHFASSLNQQGHNVVLCEQRGHGASKLTPSHQCDWSYDVIIKNDLKAILQWVNKKNPGKKYLLGHSIGGQYATIGATLFAEYFDGLILVAAGMPYHRAHPIPMNLALFLGSFIIPPISTILGYFPMKTIMMGQGAEAKTLMNEWAMLVRTNDFRHLSGFETTLEQAISQYKGPILNVHYEDDFFVPPKCNQCLIRRFNDKKVRSVLFTQSDLDHKADHFEFLKKPRITVDAIEQWVRKQ